MSSCEPKENVHYIVKNIPRTIQVCQSIFRQILLKTVCFLTSKIECMLRT